MPAKKNQIMNPNGRGDKLDLKAILAGIVGTSGIKTAVCKRLSITRPTLNTYLEKYPEAQEAMLVEKSEIGDLVESKMIKLIKEDNPTMIIFYAKTQMKNRGYVERQEIKQESDQRITVFVAPEDIKNIDEWEKTKNSKSPAAQE